MTSKCLSICDYGCPFASGRLVGRDTTYGLRFLVIVAAFVRGQNGMIFAHDAMKTRPSSPKFVNVTSACHAIQPRNGDRPRLVTWRQSRKFTHAEATASECKVVGVIALSTRPFPSA